MKLPHWVIFGFAIVALIGMILALTSPSSADPNTASAMGFPGFQPPAAATSPPGPIEPTGKMILLPKNLLLSSGTVLEDFENPKEWTRLAGLGPAANKTDFKSGAQALKVAGGKTDTIVEKKVNWDLSSSLQMRLWVFHPTKDIASFEIALATRPEGSAFLTKTVTFSGQGWNLVQIGQEEFKRNGSAQWTQPVTAVRFKVKAGEEFTFDSLIANVQAVPVVMIDFDDADESAYSLAFPILKKYGLAATAYVVTAWVGTDGHLSVPQLLELQANGWTIGNHTANHDILKGLSPAEQETQLANALATLSSWGLAGGKFVAYPGGKFDSQTLAAMSQLGMLTGRSVSNAQDVFPNVNLSILRSTQDISGMSLAQVKGLVDQARASGGMITLLFHQLNSGMTLDGGDWNTGMFTEMIAYIAGQKIAVPTIADFYRLGSQEVRIRVAGE